MIQPKISVVTVCYNAAETIEKTMLSVINQTYENVEYIIIDGGSTDGTVDIIKKYADRIAYWVSEPDKGIYDAMNKGIKVATGEWINFMNAGDSFVDDEVVASVFSKICHNHDVCFGNTIRTRQGKLLKQRTPIPFYNRRYPFMGVGICHQAIFCRTILSKQFLFDLNYKICADYDQLMKMRKNNANFHYINRDIALFDITGVSSEGNYIQFMNECYTIAGKKQKITFVFYYLFMLFRFTVIHPIKKLFINY